MPSTVESNLSNNMAMNSAVAGVMSLGSKKASKSYGSTGSRVNLLGISTPDIVTTESTSGASVPNASTTTSLVDDADADYIKRVKDHIKWTKENECFKYTMVGVTILACMVDIAILIVGALMAADIIRVKRGVGPAVLLLAMFVLIVCMVLCSCTGWAYEIDHRHRINPPKRSPKKPSGASPDAANMQNSIIDNIGTNSAIVQANNSTSVEPATVGAQNSIFDNTGVGHVPVLDIGGTVSNRLDAVERSLMTEAVSETDSAISNPGSSLVSNMALHCSFLSL